MRRLALALVAAVVLVWPGRAPATDAAGDFAYYVLALSWSPAWCESEGDSRGAAQCAPGNGHGFVLHGLWPQHRDGWPEYCATPHPDPGPGALAGMVGPMPSAGLARHQWQKHGRCSGLAPGAYFALARRAWETVRRPALLRQATRPVRLAPEVVEAAFLEANPDLTPEAIIVTCRDGLIREVRLCLDKALAPRPCTGPAARECPLPAATLVPVR